MSPEKTEEVVRGVVESAFGAAPADDALAAARAVGPDWSHRLSLTIRRELAVGVTPADVEGCASLTQLSALVGRLLPVHSDGRSIVDVYEALERIAREELHPDIRYRWGAHWSEFSGAGNWLTTPDGLDYVELVMRAEEEFGFGIPNGDAERLRTVGETVRYLWRRCLTWGFSLRSMPGGVCPGAFVFNELRRLLMVRGGVPRGSVRPDARLDSLLPTWHLKFWEQVQSVFRVELPRGNPLAFGFRKERRTTVKELVSLITPAYNARAGNPDGRQRAGEY